VSLLFKSLSQNNTLKSLSISDNGIIQGFEEMKNYFKNNSSLTYLEMKYLSSGGMDVPSILLENKILRTIDLEGVQVDQKEMEKILKSMRVNHSIFKIIFLNSDKLNAHLYNCIQQLARNNKECFMISTHFKFGFKKQNNLFCRFS
jgi:hypothetical protein